MKRFISLLVLALVALPVAAVFAEAPAEQPPPPAKKKYKIEMKDGGSLDTESYVIEGNKVRLNLPAGAISLDKAMVKCIVEVKDDETETVQKTFAPSAGGDEGARPAERPAAPAAPAAPSGGAKKYEQTDDNGHPERWWKARVNEWQVKLTDAEKKYKKAQDDWNKYNGLLGSVEGQPSTPEFSVTQYQDLRGSARVEMDKAQADMDEAKKMLDEVIPDEARKAGAPPGWVR